MGRALTIAMNEVIARLDIEGSCVYGDGPIWHVLLGRGAHAISDGTLAPACADTLTLRQANKPEVKAALQKGMLLRGVDLMSGHAGIMSTAHTDADLDRTISAFEVTLRDMRENHLL
jgi:glutamate-1-semialdehyde aminotransferase